MPRRKPPSAPPPATPPAPAQPGPPDDIPRRVGALAERWLRLYEALIETLEAQREALLERAATRGLDPADLRALQVLVDLHLRLRSAESPTDDSIQRAHLKGLEALARALDGDAPR